jgi:hypothetical protein
MKWIAIIVIALAVPGVCAAQAVYKCRDGAGHTAYQARPCGAGMTPVVNQKDLDAARQLQARRAKAVADIRRRRVEALRRIDADKSAPDETEVVPLKTIVP